MKTLKRKLAAILAITGCVVALQSGPVAAETMTTGVDPTFAPMAMPNLGGGLRGFSIDLGHALAKELGVDLKIEATQFTAIIPALTSGRYDFILAPTTATKQRAQNMLFSEGYIDTDYTFVLKKGSSPVTSLKALEGKTITANSGSAYAAWLEANDKKYGFEYHLYGTTADAIQAVLSGLAYATLIDNLSGSWAAKQNSMLQTSYKIKSGKVFALAFRKNDQKTRKRVANALYCLKKKGELAGLVKKWFGYTPEKGAASVTVTPGLGVKGLTNYDPAPVNFTCKP